MIYKAPDRHHRRQALIISRTVAASRAVWAKADPANLDSSWAQLIDGLNATVSGGQFLAAAQADRYLGELLVEQRAGLDATAAVDAASFAQIDVASLYSPVVASKTAVARGAAVQEAMLAGVARLIQVVTTATADAGRQAVVASMAAHPAVARYSRMVRPPACSRCVLLSGNVYTLNDGFARHPMCKCVHIPLAEDLENDLTTDPAAYFRGLSVEDQDKYFTKAGAEAIRDGADIGQVVNARKGMFTAADGHLATRAGTSRRGLAGRRMASAPGPAELVKVPGSRYLRVETIRPMPEAIYRQAADRDDAVRLLREFGYLV